MSGKTCLRNLRDCALYLYVFCVGGAGVLSRTTHETPSAVCGVSILSKCVIFNVELVVMYMYSCKLTFAVLVAVKIVLLKSFIC